MKYALAEHEKKRKCGVRKPLKRFRIPALLSAGKAGFSETQRCVSDCNARLMREGSGASRCLITVFINAGFQAVVSGERWTQAVLTAYDGAAMSRVSRTLAEYAESKGIYMKINHVNADHAYALVDLSTGVAIEELIQLLKGGSSHWINSNDIVTGKFAWGRGYGAFSVSQSNVSRVARYIADKEEHHRMRAFAEEFREFIDRHGLRWHDEQSR
jgi:REP element-mobilizing transposase RayT